MSEDTNVAEAEVVETAAETAEAPAAEAKAAKKKAEPRVEEALYCTDVANSEGTVHAQIQRFVFDNPGATKSAVVAALAGHIATKEASASEKYVGSYIAGGLRRGYLTTDASKVAAEFPTKVRKTAKKSEKVAAGELTKQGRALIEALEGVISANGAERSTTVSVETLSTALGNKPTSHMARTFTKLEKDGFVTITKDEAGKITGIALTDKEVPAASAEAEAPAAAE